MLFIWIDAASYVDTVRLVESYAEDFFATERQVDVRVFRWMHFNTNELPIFMLFK